MVIDCDNNPQQGMFLRQLQISSTTYTLDVVVHCDGSVALDVENRIAAAGRSYTYKKLKSWYSNAFYCPQNKVSINQ